MTGVPRDGKHEGAREADGSVLRSRPGLAREWTVAVLSGECFRAFLSKLYQETRRKRTLHLQQQHVKERTVDE